MRTIAIGLFILWVAYIVVQKPKDDPPQTFSGLESLIAHFKTPVFKIDEVRLESSSSHSILAESIISYCACGINRDSCGYSCKSLLSALTKTRL